MAVNGNPFLRRKIIINLTKMLSELYYSSVHPAFIRTVHFRCKRND